MNDLIFYYSPKTQIRVMASSTSIRKFHSKYVLESENEINFAQSYAILFKINFRKCLFGEYYRIKSHK